MNWYEAKQEARRERLEAASERAARESDAHHRASHAATEGIPFGQPILVGHHSEGRHRRALDRSWNQLGKAVEADKRSKALAYRAAAVGSGGISSDDPDAVAKLREELADKVASRDAMKAANKAYRDARKRKAERPASAELVTELATTYAIPESMARLAADWTAEYSFQKGPFEGYSFQNIGANIRRIEQRIEQLEQRAKLVDEMEQTGAVHVEQRIGEVRIVENFAANRLQIFFPGKPSAEVRTQLKGRGFRWAPSEGAWQRHLTGNARWAAEEIVKGVANAC